MKNFFRYNRTAAFIALAVIILLSVILGAGRSSGALRNKAEKLYSSGNDKYGVPKDDMTKLCNYAEQLCAIGTSYGYDTEKFTSDIQALKNALGSALTVADCYDNVYSDASLLYNQLNADPECVKSENSFISYFYEITSVKMRLANNAAYEKAAEKYNNALNSPVVFGKKSPAAVFS